MNGSTPKQGLGEWFLLVILLLLGVLVVVMHILRR
jgi:hypothetical protein